MHLSNTRRGLAIAALAIACACAGRSQGPPPAAAPGGGAGGTLRHTHENLNAVLWMQTAAEYEASAIQAYRLAQLQLDAALADPSWTAAVEQTEVSGPPAVVLDLDETVLDNSAFEARLAADGAPYTEDAWNRWAEERKAGAVPGALEFLRYAVSRGVTPFYVTNRDHRVEGATRDVLARLGVPVSADRDVVLARHENGWDASDKSSRRQAIAATHRILLLIGDNFEDSSAARGRASRTATGCCSSTTRSGDGSGSCCRTRPTDPGRRPSRSAPRNRRMPPRSRRSTAP